MFREEERGSGLATRKSKFPPVQGHGNRVRGKNKLSLSPQCAVSRLPSCFCQKLLHLKEAMTTHTLKMRHVQRLPTPLGQEWLLLDEFYSPWLPWLLPSDVNACLNLNSWVGGEDLPARRENTSPAAKPWAKVRPVLRVFGRWWSPDRKCVMDLVPHEASPSQRPAPKVSWEKYPISCLKYA